MRSNPTRGCFGAQKSNGAERSWIPSFLDFPAEPIPPGKRERRYSMGRGLRPGGKLILFEDGLSPDPQVRRWQERLEPLFRWAFEGCHATRDIPSLIGEGGFNIEQMDAGYFPPFPKSPSYCWWGIAVPELRK